MSLPAGQQRVLDGMERTLQESEPHMASMYAIFARLHEGTEPVGAEPLKRRRWRNLHAGAGQSGRAMYAMALIPVLFIMVVAGVLLGGSAHGLTTCGSGSAAFGGSPWVTRSSCQTQTSGKATSGQATSGQATSGSKGSKDPKGAAVLSGTGLVGVSCAAIALTVRAAAKTGAKLPFVPSPSGAAGTRSPPAMCYK